MARTVAQDVFRQLQAFGGYSFPKSHAAAFAVLVYRSAWLKCHYPLAFYTALLNHQPMGFWSPAVLVNDARHHGIPVRPVSLRHSRAACTVEGEALRLGFTYVAGLGDQGSALIEAAREAGEFQDLADFCQRTRLPRRLVEHLILVGAMDEWGQPRRQLLWQLGEIRYTADELDLIFPRYPVRLPALSRADALFHELTLLGLSTGDHVMTLYRPWLAEQGILGSRALLTCPTDRRVRVAGQVVMHQAPPTAKGHHFITLEDEDGMINVIVRPDVYAHFDTVLRHSPLLLVEGQVQRQGQVISLLLQRTSPLTTPAL